MNIRIETIVVLLVVVVMGFLTFPQYTSYDLAHPKSVEESIQKKTIIFFGDMMLDRRVRIEIEKQGYDYPFRELEKIMRTVAPQGWDEVIVNAEGVFTDYESVTRDLSGKYLRFTFDPSWLEGIKNAGITHLSQANNHTSDFGREGYATSVQYISEYGLSSFGSPYNTDHIAYIDFGTQKIALIGYNQFIYGREPQEDIAITKKLIQREKEKGYFVVVYPHWGDEYVIEANEFQEMVAREFVDAGAGLIVGAHPHVIQNNTFMMGEDNTMVPIYYSLGNFIFDQAFQPEVREGKVIAVTLELHATENSNIRIKNISENIFDIRVGQALVRE